MCTVQIRIVFGVYLEVTPDEVRTKLGILGIFSFGDVSVPIMSVKLILGHSLTSNAGVKGLATRASNG